MNTLLYLFLTLLLLSIMVVIHELGHFLFAKLFKVTVLEFSVGMGPAIFTTKNRKRLKKSEKSDTTDINEDGTPTARTEKILAHTPMGRFGEPEDLLGALLWLVDDKAAGFVTGTVIPVDGGFAAYSGV